MRSGTSVQMHLASPLHVASLLNCLSGTDWVTNDSSSSLNDDIEANEGYSVYVSLVPSNRREPVAVYTGQGKTGGSMQSCFQFCAGNSRQHLSIGFFTPHSPIYT